MEFSIPLLSVERFTRIENPFSVNQILDLNIWAELKCGLIAVYNKVNYI